MGYYTNYQIEIRSKDPINDDVMSQINKAFCELWLENHYEQINWNEWFYNRPSEDDLKSPNFIQCTFLDEEQKWYNWREEMTELSKRFPSIGFILCGEGEERGDDWMTAFLGGESEVSYGSIVYEYNSLKDEMSHWEIN